MSQYIDVFDRKALYLERGLLMAKYLMKFRRIFRSNLLIFVTGKFEARYPESVLRCTLYTLL